LGTAASVGIGVLVGGSAFRHDAFMETIATGPLKRDREKFLTLLSAARDAAREDGCAKLVSVSLSAGAHIDPLAVLESIYEQGERHFYYEHPERDLAIAGAESVMEASFAGTDRFVKAAAFAEEVFANAIAVGEMDLPLAGPKLFAAFAFEDEATPEAPFAPATLFVPRWQVSSFEGAYVATANLLVTPEGDIEAQADRALAAHAKFSGFAYTRTAPEASRREPIPEPAESEGAFYRARVKQALAAIGEAKAEKIVVARRREFETSSPLHPLRTLAALREKFPSCRSFSFGSGSGASFIGATPELLVRVSGESVESEALAGTAPRGEGAAEDAALAATLMSSEKQLREHAAVARAVKAALESCGLDTGPMPRPRIRRLPNAQHILTPFSARRKADTSLFSLAGALHPTPATSGLPCEAARRLLAEIEGAPRGLYAGPIGWCGADGCGELAVALRSGLVEGSRAVLHAGAGIVRGSVPQEEDAETLLKLGALAGCLV
jgi:menaquinone-specific isochorismate synthase